MGDDACPEKAAAPPATPRHPNHSLPLLPSGPGGVCELSSRGDRRGHHRRGLLQPGAPAGAVAHFFQLAERAGFEPAIRGYRIHAFQACSLDRSDTSPFINKLSKGARDYSMRSIAASTGGVTVALVAGGVASLWPGSKDGCAFPDTGFIAVLLGDAPGLGAVAGCGLINCGGLIKQAPAASFVAAIPSPGATPAIA